MTELFSARSERMYGNVNSMILMTMSVRLLSAIIRQWTRSAET
mgnify:CR=1 FL=1